MKQLVRLLIVIILIFGNLTTHAKKQKETAKDDVTLIVTSDGATKDEAIKNALRSAIEQTYGIFVSANTDILNDEVVKDEIATISSGNIKKYNEIAITESPNKDKVSATLEVVVSKGKLLKYAKSKGAECEFDGSALAADIELQILYRNNEQAAVKNLINEFNSQIKNCFDYELFLGDFSYNTLEIIFDDLNGYYNLISPEISNTDNTIYIPYKVVVNLNSNGKEILSDFINKLSLIGFPTKADLYDNKTYPYHFQVPFVKLVKPKTVYFGYPRCSHPNLVPVPLFPSIRFRSEESLQQINTFIYGTINEFFTDFYLDSDETELNSNNVSIVGDDGILRKHNDGGIYRLTEPITLDPGAEYFFSFGRITLPISEIKKVNSIKLVHN